MKKLVSLMVLMVPLLATAEITVDKNALENSVAMTSILDGQVRLADGRELGKIKDALLEDEQHVEQFLLDIDVSDEYNRGVASFPDDVADYGEAPLYEGKSTDRSLELEYVALPPEHMRYNPSTHAVEFDLDSKNIPELPRSDGPVINSPQPYASQLIGLEVRLADEESFGSVEDIMLAEDGGGVLAYVVDSWDLLIKRRHALPADAARFIRAEKDNAIRENYGIEAIQFPYSSRQLEELQQFDLDAHKKSD